MSLLDLVTGGKASQSNKDLENALADIQGVNVPTADQMKFKLQQLVQAGVLTPQQAKTFLQSPNAMESMNIDQTGTNAQQEALAGILGAAQQGGLNPQEQAQMAEINRQTGAQEKGANDAVLQNQAARGALTGGETLAAQLQNNQNATVNANQNASNTAGQAYQQMLNELTSAGSLGAGLQGQQNQQGNTVAAATNAINQFNTAQQQNQENYNVGNQNTAQQFNLENQQGISNQNVGNENAHAQYEAQLPQQVFGDQMQKAGAEAGISEQQANLDTQQGGQMAGLLGGIIGTGGEIASAGMQKPPTFGGADTYAAAEGGEVPQDIHNYLNGGKVNGHAQVPGNSPKNDTVPSMLSPKEIVIPRSAAIPSMHGDDSKVMEFLQRMRQKKEPAPVHPHDMRSVLDALALRRGQS